MIKEKLASMGRPILRSKYHELKHHGNVAVNYARLVLDDIESGNSQLSIDERLSAWKKGFTSQETAIFDTNEYMIEDFISGYDMSMYRSKIDYNGYTRNKLLFYKLFDEYHPETIPEVYGIVNERGVYSTEGQYLTSDIEGWFEEIIQQEGKLVSKPVEGWGGKGVKIIDEERDDFKQIDFSEYIDHMIMDYLDPSEYIQDIYPKSANAVRITTIWDSKHNKPFIGCANQRIGTDVSAPADNFTAGGLSAQIDCDTGELSKAAMISNDGVNWYSNHPDTGNQIEGINVDNWGAVKSTILKIATQLRYIPLISWDVIITDEGMKILEGNTVPGFKTEQVHKPLLSDKRIRRHFKNIISYNGNI